MSPPPPFSPPHPSPKMYLALFCFFGLFLLLFIYPVFGVVYLYMSEIPQFSCFVKAVHLLQIPEKRDSRNPIQSIDDDSPRVQPKHFVVGSCLRVGLNIIVFRLQHTSNLYTFSSGTLVMNGRPIIWPGGGSEPVLGRPVCGWDNETCAYGNCLVLVKIYVNHFRKTTSLFQLHYSRYNTLCSYKTRVRLNLISTCRSIQPRG